MAAQAFDNQPGLTHPAIAQIGGVLPPRIPLVTACQIGNAFEPALFTLRHGLSYAATARSHISGNS
jgi:hypothetical protein